MAPKKNPDRPIGSDLPPIGVPQWFYAACVAWVEAQSWQTPWAHEMALALWPAVQGHWLEMDSEYRHAIADFCIVAAGGLDAAVRTMEEGSNDPESTAYLRGRLDAFNTIARKVLVS